METEHGDCLLFHGYHVTNNDKATVLNSIKFRLGIYSNRNASCTLCIDDSLLPFKEAYQKKKKKTFNESKKENSTKLNLPELFQFLRYIILQIERCHGVIYGTEEKNLCFKMNYLSSNSSSNTCLICSWSKNIYVFYFPQLKIYILN